VLGYDVSPPKLPLVTLQCRAGRTEGVLYNLTLLTAPYGRTPGGVITVLVLNF
jgi:hypothetical protein